MEGGCKCRVIPLKELKVRPVYSARKEIACSIAVVLGMFWMSSLLADVMLRYPISFNTPILFTAVCLVYLLYKRRSYNLLAEDGLYFIRKGYALYVPWARVSGAKVAHGAVWSYIQPEFDTALPWERLTASGKECRFRQTPQTEACFQKHVTVAGVGKKAG